MSDHRTDDNERDQELARLLAGIVPPEHRTDFWATLRGELHRAAGDEPHSIATDDDTSDDEGAGTVTPMRQPAGGRRAPTPAADRRRWPLVAAAAALVVALVGGGYLLRQDDRTGDQDLITDPDLAPPSPDATDPVDPDRDPGDVVLPQPAGDPVERGSGRALAVDPTGSFLYLADTAPEGGTGCEGAPLAALYVEPIGGGDRTLVADAETIDVTTTYGGHVSFDGDGNAAIVSQCEGNNATVHTSTVQDDGTFGEVTSVRLGDLDLGQPVDAILDIEFRRPGVLVAVTLTRADDGTDHRHLYEFPAGTDDVTDLGVDEPLGLAVDAAERIAAFDYDGRVILGAVLDGPDGGVSDIAITPDGRYVVTTGPLVTEVLLLDDDGVVSAQQVPLPGVDIPYVGDGFAIVIASKEMGAATAVALNLLGPTGDEAQRTLAQGSIGLGFVVTPDLSRIIATEASDDGSTFTIVEQRLSR